MHFMLFQTLSYLSLALVLMIVFEMTEIGARLQARFGNAAPHPTPLSPGDESRRAYEEAVTHA